METRIQSVTNLDGDIVAIRVLLTQNDVTAIIAETNRGIVPDWEPLERVTARAMRIAAEWLDAGRVDLTPIGGAIARSATV